MLLAKGNPLAMPYCGMAITEGDPALIDNCSVWTQTIALCGHRQLLCADTDNCSVWTQTIALCEQHEDKHNSVAHPNKTSSQPTGVLPILWRYSNNSTSMSWVPDRGQVEVVPVPTKKKGQI